MLLKLLLCLGVLLDPHHVWDDEIDQPTENSFCEHREMMTEVTNHYHPQADTICINLKSICLLGGANLREYVSHWELWTSTIKATICSILCIYIYTVYTYVCVAFAMLIRNAIIPDHFALCGESSSDLRNGRADEPDETAKIHWPAEEIPPWVQLFGQGRGCDDESSTMLNTDSTHPKTKDYSCRSLYHEPFCSTRPDPEPGVKQPMYQ